MRSSQAGMAMIENLKGLVKLADHDGSQVLVFVTIPDSGVDYLGISKKCDLLALQKRIDSILGNVEG